MKYIEGKMESRKRESRKEKEKNYAPL